MINRKQTSCFLQARDVNDAVIGERFVGLVADAVDGCRRYSTDGYCAER